MSCNPKHRASVRQLKCAWLLIIKSRMSMWEIIGQPGNYFDKLLYGFMFISNKTIREGQFELP